MKATDSFKFSEHYAKYRPDYPQALFDFLTTLGLDTSLALDCGAGNAQAARALAKRFDTVVATEQHLEQLQEAKRCQNIYLVCGSAEQLPIKSNTVDLLCVAQALHWFNFIPFYKEVNRLVKSGGILAVWCYGLGGINPALDHIIQHLYNDILGDAYWAPERRYIDKRYTTLPFPFEEISSPQFSASRSYTFSDFLGYLNTWSAVKAYEAKDHSNPLQPLIPEFEKAWGAKEQEHTMKWPIFMRVARL